MKILKSLQKGKLKSLLSSLLIGVLSLSIIGTAPIALAIVSYNVSGGNPGTLTVGTPATLSGGNAIVLSANAGVFTGGTVLFAVQLDTTDYPNIAFNPGPTLTVTADGTNCFLAPTTQTPTVPYTNNNTTASFSVTGVDCSGTTPSTITFSGLQVVGKYATAGAAVSPLTVAAGAISPIQTSSTTAIVTNAATINPTVAFTIGGVTQNPVTVGQTITTTISGLNPPVALTSGQNVIFINNGAANYDDTNVSYASDTFGSGGNFSSCFLINPTVTTIIWCTVGAGKTIAAGTPGNIVLNGVVGSYVSGATTSSQVLLVGPGNTYTIAQSPVSIALPATVVGAFTSTPTVTVNAPNPGATVAATVTFSTPLSIATSNDIDVTFPTGFVVTGANNATCPGLSGTLTTMGSGSTVTISGGSAAAGTQTCTINGIINPVTPATPTGTFTVLVTTSVPQNRFTGTAAGINIQGTNNNSSNQNSGTVYGTSATQVVTTGVGTTTSTSTNTTTSAATTGTNTAVATGTEQATEQTTGTVETTGTEQTSSEQTTGGMTTPFTDISTHWAESYITTLYNKGIVSGRTPTLYVPDGDLTRAEMVKIALLAFGYPVTPGATPTFSDVSPTDWFASYVAAAQKANIVSGYSDGTFGPNTPVTRAEALKILLTAAANTKTISYTAAAAPFTDVDQSAWYAQYVNLAYAKGIVSGETVTLFAPNADVTRGEMAKMAVNAMNM